MLDQWIFLWDDTHVMTSLAWNWIVLKMEQNQIPLISLSELQTPLRVLNLTSKCFKQNPSSTAHMLTVWYMSKTQNLGVSRWCSTSCAKFWVAQPRHLGFFGLTQMHRFMFNVITRKNQHLKSLRENSRTGKDLALVRLQKTELGRT